MLGVNTEETKCVDKARRQRGGQNDNMKVADKFLETCGRDQRFGNDTNKSQLRGRRRL